MLTVASICNEMEQCQMSKLKVQMKSEAQSREDPTTGGKHMVLDFLGKGKNILTLSHLSFI
jgi:hypothetical protein